MIDRVNALHKKHHKKLELDRETTIDKGTNSELRREEDQDRNLGR